MYMLTLSAAMHLDVLNKEMKEKGEPE